MRPKKLPSIHCPHCKAPAFVRSSEQMTDTVREARYLCTNVECDHQFIVEMAIVRTIVPSRMPDALANIPGGNVDRRKGHRRPGNDNEPIPANDDSDRPAAAHMTD